MTPFAPWVSLSVIFTSPIIADGIERWEEICLFEGAAVVLGEGEGGIHVGIIIVDACVPLE